MEGASYLLIDSHNVICATQSLRDLLDSNQDAARDQLAERVRSIHDAEGVRVALVMDSKQKSLQVEHPYGKDTFEFLYAPDDLTADGVIERIVRRAPNPSCMTVVSNDNYVREATRSVGAIALRPDELFEWADSCERRLRVDVERRRAMNGKEFRNGIELDL